MTELGARLQEVSEAAEALKAAEDATDAARSVLVQALRAAHDAGASHALLGRLAGVSRQRVAQLVRGD
jgi:hypothetical protein